MKRPDLPRIAIPFALMLCIPFAYNSCHGGLLGGGYSSSSRCKLALENGELKKVTIDDRLPPKPFAASKVRLRTESTGQQKASVPLSLAKGTELSVIMDNACLERGELDGTVISRAAKESRQLLAGMDRQAYPFRLDRDYSENDLEQLANQENCVVGVSWNKKYKLQAMAFNDSNYASQTHLPAIHAPNAYDLFYNATGGMTYNGPAVQVAIVDTGVDWTHPDLAPDLWIHTLGAGIDITTLGTPNVSYNPMDVSDIGHGTHVSGLIGAVANNSQGTVGAMPYRVQIMGIKVFKLEAGGELTTTSQYFYNAIKYAYLNNASVVNLSLGSITTGADSDPVAESGVDEALQHGVVVVTVIGNADSGNGVNIDGVTTSSIPGQYAVKPGVIGVGAFDTANGQKSYFSHYSTTYAEIGAPGAESGNNGLFSTLPTAKGSYGRLAGTSQAAPLVSAAAALTIGLIRNAYGTPPTPAEVERLIVSSAVKSPQLNSYFKDGNRVDYLNLVQKIRADYPRTTMAAGAAGSSNCP